MDYQKSYAIFCVCTAVGLLLCALYAITDMLAIGVVSVVVLLGGMVQAFFFYRCPYCGSHFSTREKMPAFCPECGRPLD